MTQPPSNDDNLYTERELAEIDELNRATRSDGGFLQSRWWKRIGIAFAVVIVASFALPIVAGLGSGGGGGGSSDLAPAESLAVPDFALESAQGGVVRLSERAGANSAVVLVFYRGYF